MRLAARSVFHRSVDFILAVNLAGSLSFPFLDVHLKRTRSYHKLDSP